VFLFSDDFYVASNLTGEARFSCNKGYSECNYCAAPILPKPQFNDSINFINDTLLYPIIFFAVCKAGSDSCQNAISKQQACFFQWEQPNIHGGTSTIHCY
jgi:hypothetical protein